MRDGVRELIQATEKERDELRGVRIAETKKSKPYKRTFKKLYRNDKCPCGSQEKVKKCHPELL